MPAEANAALRQEIDQQLTNGPTVVGLLSQLWSRDPSPSTAAFVISRFDRLRPITAMTGHRLAILRSFTLEPAVGLLRAGALLSGIELTVRIGQFNAYTQEILDPQSSLYEFQPQSIVLAVQTRDIAPELWQGFSELSAEKLTAVASRVVQEFEQLMRTFRSHCSANLIIHSLERPAEPSQGILDLQVPAGQAATIERINAELCRLAADMPGVYVLDYDGLAARYGKQRWHDERKWLTMRLPISGEGLQRLAAEWLRFLHPLAGRVCKVVVTDLDGTLWGGVIGEDTVTGIKLGLDYPGAAYRAVQQALVDLHHRGILLAVCSKNNEADALEALQAHPAMLVRPAQFAAIRANWNDKAQNLREIAADLNVGLDALAFLDDNPVERQRIRAELPEVTVIDLPDDPMDFAAALRSCPAFERLTLSVEDRQRGQFYAEQRLRSDLQIHAASLEDFYRSLGQVVSVAPAQPEDLARVAQLTQKTNQFNLTTRRYSEQQIREHTAQAAYDLYSVHVHDRFGDNGLVGVVMTKTHDVACEIDTFLLSCRVIGRTIETAVLSRLAERARTRGCTELQGWFLPTKKNAPAKDFYPAHGFRLIEQSECGTYWSLDLRQASPACPEWITLTNLETLCA